MSQLRSVTIPERPVVLSWTEAQRQGWTWERWQNEWFENWKAGKVSEDYPCGCTGRIVQERDAKRLVIRVNVKCPYDAPKIGMRNGFLRYEVKAERRSP
jgi:hypothetical protein